MSKKQQKEEEQTSDHAELAKPKNEVAMKCRRSSDKAYAGTTCKGMQAEKLTADGSRFAQFKCTTCGHIWSVNLGGSIDL